MPCINWFGLLCALTLPYNKERTINHVKASQRNARFTECATPFVWPQQPTIHPHPQGLVVPLTLLPKLLICVIGIKCGFH
jgi:hypothetical protein